MKIRYAVLACLLAVGCGETESKNSDLNNTLNNASNSGSNSTPNNASNSGSNNTSNNAGGDIIPSNYNQSCQVEEDCMLILSGDPCGCGPCMDASINVNDERSYQGDKNAGMCTEIACPAIGCGDEQLAHCNAGMCEVRVAKHAVAEDFDQACTVDEDCVAVFDGEICAPCQSCQNAAINVADLEDYKAQFDVMCEHNVDCACAPATTICNEGRCEITSD